MTSIASPKLETQSPTKAGRWPLLLQIALIMVLLFAPKLIPDLPYSGQFAMLLSLIGATWLLRRDGQRWRDLGLRWATSKKDLAKGAGMVVLVFVCAVAANAVVQPILTALLGSAAERDLPDVSTIQLYLIFMVMIWTTASFGEEMVFRGFLMDRLSKIFGGTRYAWVLAAFIQAAIFGVGHAYQGIGGILVTGVVGLVFGLLYLVARRNLWPVIIGHALINTVGFTVLHLQATGAFPAS